MSDEQAAMTKPPTAEGLVEISGEGYYAVREVEQMPPFLMSVVSDGDRWMFVSSAGGLTAGRGDPSRALFRYETDDRLHDSAGFVGPVTAIRISTAGTDVLWQPFRELARAPVRRTVYKSVVGSSIIFEEHHADLRLTFRYRWASCDRFGFVRTATLTNDGDEFVRTELIDGLLNLLPYGLEPSLYATKNNLTNAYKRSEVIDTESRLAVFSLESGVVDRPEPAEVLRGSIAWSFGLEQAAVTVNPDVLSAFETGRTEDMTTLLTGRPGAYLLSGSVDLIPGEEKSWNIVADVAQDQLAVVGLRSLLHSGVDLPAAVATSLDESTRSLVEIMAPADALQRTGDRVATAHQFANVVYNSMRGGVPPSRYRVNSADFAGFLADRNQVVAGRHHGWLESLPGEIDRHELLQQIKDMGDAHLLRLGLEYLPFSFSRRHGDPSRPWNAFSIRVRDADGEPVFYYEGNWRDIFQNWEALCLSFPAYLPGTIAIFVNASTPDGFNPYRISRHGIDWEVPDPDDPWSNIGYWGDHQIVYLLRLLEAGDRFLPGEVSRLLGERFFSYADVPYRIAPYDHLVRDPHATIDFDEVANTRSSRRVADLGGDGKLLHAEDGEIHLVSLIEKLLVPALSKLSNFVPGGGIWMNTQRPEWNDANNALVGFGLSMVTVYHLRRYLNHLRSLIRDTELTEVGMSTEVADWLFAAVTGLQRSQPEAGRHSERNRKEFMDELGRAFASYRARVYEAGFSGFTMVALARVSELCDAAIEHLDDTIRANRRPDGLYHSYNLIRFSPDQAEASVEHLYEMLEGQVAVLSSGVLSPEEQAEVIDALFASAMYRDDQDSFMLYPSRQVPSFLEKNVVAPEAVSDNPLLAALLQNGDQSVIARDADGRFRFNADFHNEDDLDAALDHLAHDPAWTTLVAAHRVSTLRTYEDVFDHHSYTGRSGSMYGYEGIGSIYWHMVAKLVVAAQEAALEAAAAGASSKTLARLTAAYWRIRSGLGFNKTAREFGAIPLDPYSHTPSHAGAQQPGMTGAVKEELLTRPLELGVRIEQGEIRFDTLLLRRRELLDQPESWCVYDLGLQPHKVELSDGSMGMTLCQVPVVVSVTDGEPGIDVVFKDGTTEHVVGCRLDPGISAEIFARSGKITRIHASLSDGALNDA